MRQTSFHSLVPLAQRSTSNCANGLENRSAKSPCQRPTWNFWWLTPNAETSWKFLRGNPGEKRAPQLMPAWKKRSSDPDERRTRCAADRTTFICTQSITSAIYYSAAAAGSRVTTLAASSAHN